MNLDHHQIKLQDQIAPEPKQVTINLPQILKLQKNLGSDIKTQINLFSQEEKPKENNPNKVGHYILNKCIGSGSFGKVYLGLHLITGEKVAIKMIQKQRISSKFIQRIKRQIKILCKLHHPSIIQLYQIVQQKKHIYLIMQYVPHGQLFNYIVKNKRLSEQDACYIFQQIISGVQYFHTMGVAHRDLKPENILIDDNNKIKIIDFGLSNTYEKNQKLRTACGSPCYVPPEMILQKCQYDPLPVDIWSTGIILYAMLCGCLPFMDNHQKKIYQKIKIGYFKVPKTLSYEAKILIARMLSVDPLYRISIPEIRSHKWWQTSKQPKLYGIYYPKHRIPIQNVVVEKMKTIPIFSDNDHTHKIKSALEKNLHVPETASYYLLLKKYVKQGNFSRCYINSPNFDPMLLQPQFSHFQDVQSTDIPTQLPPNRSTMAPLQPENADYNFQIFMPWEQLYYRIAQLTQLKNNHFLTVLLNSNKKSNQSYKNRNKKYRSNVQKQKYHEKTSVQLPSIKQNSYQKRQLRHIKKSFPVRYSGYKDNLSYSQFEKIKKINQNSQQSLKKIKNYSNTKHATQRKHISIQKQKFYKEQGQKLQIKQLIELLEQLALSKNSFSSNLNNEIPQLKQVHTKRQQKISIRYKFRNRGN